MVENYLNLLFPYFPFISYFTKILKWKVTQRIINKFNIGIHAKLSNIFKF